MGKKLDFVNKYWPKVMIPAFMSGMVFGLTSLCSMVGDSCAGPHANYSERKQIEQEEGRWDPFRAIAYLADNHGYLMKPFMWPWEASGYVPFDDRDRLWQKVLEEEGIDEKDPADNDKRYNLYRKFGLAVREGADENIAIRIDDMLTYLDEDKRDYDPDWDYVDNMNPILLGKAYFKADSKDMGGNEDGVVQDKEWRKALNLMGYYTQEEYIDYFVEGFDEDNRESVKEKVLEELEANPNLLDSVTGGPEDPMDIPENKLEFYLKMV